MTFTTRQRRRWIGVLLVVVILSATIAGYTLPLRAWLESMHYWEWNRGAAGVFTFTSIYAGAVLALLPSSVFNMSAGVSYGLWGGTFISLCGATIGAGIAYFISRYLGRLRFQRWLETHPRMKAINGIVSQHPWKIVLLCRLAPIIPFGPVNYALGLTTVRFSQYITATAIGVLPGTFLYTYAGYAGYALFGNDESRSVLDYAILMGGLLAAVIVVLILSRMAKRALNEMDQGTAA